jgi:DNA methylase
MIGTGPLNNQLSLLDGWTALRSPKVKPGDREGVYAWSRLYSAFSEAFVLEALARLRKSHKDIILDPFVGSGTTILAASKMGNPAIGIDLDPYSCMLARAAVAINADPRVVQKLLTQRNLGANDVVSESAPRIFGQNDIRYALGVFQQVIQRVGATPTKAWQRILNDTTGLYDSESVALAALGVGAGQAAKVVEGSNPVWVRAALNGERGVRARLQTAARQAASLMLRDIWLLKGSLEGRRVRIINADIRSWTPRPASVDIVITSPPYLNRLDYVIHHLGPLSLYGALMRIDLERMRKLMVGTTKIVGKKDESSGWGPICRRTLSAIAAHPSHASATYYYWNFHQYFGDMYTVFRKLSHACKSGARGALVAQNSFYKEMEITLPEILVEIATDCKVSARIVRQEVVRSHMGRFSPRQLPGKQLKEAVLLLEF